MLPRDHLPLVLQIGRLDDVHDMTAQELDEFAATMRKWLDGIETKRREHEAGVVPFARRPRSGGVGPVSPVVA